MNTIRLWLRQLAWWMLGNIKPAENEVDAAMRHAFASAGLNVDLYSPEFDISTSGKFHEVLFHASQELGNPLRTVNDLKELLS
jgi:hypothetical protein